MPDRRVPTSTYRLQLHAGFTFDDAANVVPYLSRLGISHLYLSPILQAAPGSTHGYDVVDHSLVSADLGGELALLALAATAHQHDLGIVVDVVPNHMAIPAPEQLNPQLWDVLRLGRDSEYAHWFDVDWDSGAGRIALPLLGDTLDEVLADGGITIGDYAGTPVIRYGDHVFPVAPGTEDDDVSRVLKHQHYVLASWQQRAEILNSRRFFDVDSLIAVRVELDDVFDATHALLLDLHARGVVDGFRIDHPDGLADPEGYLERLRERTGGAWVVVEKILEPGEELPPRWACAGTTGYDAIRAVQTALVPALGAELDERWQQMGGEPSYDRAELTSKQLVVANLFQAEVRRLATDVVNVKAGPGLTLAEATAALDELLAHVEVYRAYLRPDQPPDGEQLERLTRLAKKARQARPDLASDIDAVVALLSDVWSADPSVRDLVIRFQQVCGPVMAKGVEDTTFYRWNRLVALNEVGGDPRALDTPDIDALHGWAQHQATSQPQGLTGLSTHDTKRSEDTRARQLALVEDLAGWDDITEAIQQEAQATGVDAGTAYLLAQTLLGVWPISGDRLDGYLEKAIREAKLFTTWNDPDSAYEQRVLDLGRRCLEDPVAGLLERVVSANATSIRAVTLATKLIQLTLPGVPDVYQGSELAEPALVDPDNRRVVDYGARQHLLDSLEHERPPRGELQAEKLWVTSRALRLRRQRPDLFDANAAYAPLSSASPHALGFLRGGQAATLVTRWPGRLSRDGWNDATVDLPPGTWSDVLSGARHRVGDARARCADLLTDLPVALLLLEET
jgi:(1->4)-alpha-D-glucan 1-alpha-D-glucosylmutase